MSTVLDKNSSKVRDRIAKHSFHDEEGEEYEESEFNGFPDYYRRKKIKLQNLDADIRAASDKPPIFKGVVAFVNGYTQPPLQDLHHEIVQHGGGFLQYLDSKTMATHIIASALPPKKAIEFSKYRIVKPAWVVDSVRACRLLPWTDYRVLDEGTSQKVLKFDSAGLTQESPAARKGYREQTDNSFYTSQLQAAASPASQALTQAVSKLSNPPAGQRASPSLARKSTPRSANGTPKTPGSPGDGVLMPLEASGAGSANKVLNETPEPPPPILNVTIAESAESPEPTKNMTPEEYNAWLLSDPRIRKSSTANPDFLKQYYSESRLHHLSTWKASLKSSMQQLAARKAPSGKKLKGRSGSRRYVMHVDFDSFFCAVSLKRHPEHSEKPVVVAHSPGSGSEIASCNYVARKFGVKNGMWMKTAQELCPNLKVLPYDFPAYEEASRLFYESVIDVGGIVQSVSVDEALIDATDVILSATGSRGVGIDEGSLWREQEQADGIARKLRDQIKDKTGCAVSVGIGGNILQAKVALRKAKPAGQYQLKPDAVLDVIGDLKVEDLPGVAYSISGKLEDLGVKLVKDIRGVSRERLSAALGPKTSEKLSDYSRGIDRTEVGEQPPRKSVSAEVNWGIRFISQAEAEEFVFNLSRELEKRLMAEQVKGSNMTLKIMRRSLDAPLDPAKHLGHGKCDAFNKSVAFGVATHSYEAIGKEAVSILRSFKFSPGDLRGIGIQMTKLEPLKSISSAPDGSQPRINFAARGTTPPVKRHSRPEQIEDGGETPEQTRAKPASALDVDPIADDPLTPPRSRVHPAMALSRAALSDEKANTPLNVSGTQFIIPSNPDPYVLAQLPQDIRSRLVAQKPPLDPAGVIPRRAESASPAPADMIPSQVDAEVFNALPEEMKAEVLATYGRKAAQTMMQQQQQQQQQPSLRRNAAPARGSATPTRRGGMTGILGKAQRQRDAQAGVVQTNFRAPQLMSDGFGGDNDVEELDPDFLAELPEDVRKELIADHRQRKVARQSRLEIPTTAAAAGAQARRQRADSEDGLLPGGQRRIQFPVLPPKISFAGVASTQEIKETLGEWHSETSRAGPHRRDAEVFEKFLVKVIKDERDLNKAATLVRWLDVLVEQGGRKEGRGWRAWNDALREIKDVVQTAVRERGLAPMNI
ncbi:DNA repair protein rev1 [Escovopsis weberi]|uniref:DNA repair protein REV1 n=1 Tax=Escovopsis weberi TaxID=150374 RepID=A0A0M8MZF2_ESCWE|nr:DNA repair protein rev1 [Escovopsis weberi]